MRSSASLPALESRPFRIRVVEVEDDGGALERMLLTRETAALEVAEADVDADGAWSGAGALIGVEGAHGEAGVGPLAVAVAVAVAVMDVDVAVAGAGCGGMFGRVKPVSMEVGEAKTV